jgi:hypothetical protein
MYISSLVCLLIDWCQLVMFQRAQTIETADL